jgi:hypothetical protein
VNRETRTDHAELPTGAVRGPRYDAGRLGKVERTPTGGVRIPARVARAGVLTYRNADGTTRREYRPPEEVFHADSLRSLADAVITVGHPSQGKVSPATFREQAVGHVRGEGRRDGDFVAGELAVLDAVAIARVDAGELVELSSGYDVLYDATPGVTPQGERYDGVQRQIRHNHLALLPPGGGRSGREVALRLDAAAAIELDEQVPPTLPAPASTMRNDSMKTQRIDGIEYEVGSAAWMQACERRDAKIAADLAAAEKRATDAEAKATNAAAKATQETARADAAEKRVNELEAAAAIAAGRALVEKVRPVLGAETKLDGKSELEIMTLALAKLDPELKLDAIPEAQRETYVRARFDSEMRHAGRTSPLATARAEVARPTANTVPQGMPMKLGWDNAYRSGPRD